MKTHHDGRRRHFTAARLALSVILVTVVTFGLATPTQAGGAILHLHVLKRAIEIIDARGNHELATLLRENTWQVRYGAVFPDYGYGLEKDPLYDHSIKWGDHAQTAHEFEFVKAYFNSVKSIFGSSNPEDRKAIAFLFGVIAHNEADNPFHFGPNNFIDTAKLNDRETAIKAYSCHNFGLIDLGYDTGVDHACTEMQIDLYVRDTYEGWWIFGDYCTKWDLPENAKTAILAAYNTLGISDVTKDHLLDGYNTQGSVCGFEAQSTWVELPWVKENFINWPDGGREDMANQIAAAWQQTWDWFNNTYTPYTEVSLSSLPQDGMNASELQYSVPVNVTLTGTYKVDGQNNPNPDQDVLFTLTPFRTFYSINGSSYITYTQPLNFDTNGIYYIYYYTGDLLENRSSDENLTINIDMAPPTQPPSPQTPPTPEPCMTYHVVKSGEKTGAIAHTYHLKWKEIYKANDLGMEEKPKVGDRLCIPKSNPARRDAPTNPHIQ